MDAGTSIGSTDNQLLKLCLYSRPLRLKQDQKLGDYVVNEAICEVDEETATGANNEVMHVVRDAGH